MLRSGAEAGASSFTGADMKRNLGLFAAAAATFFAACTCAAASSAAQQKISSVQYLVGTWNCAHTVGAFSGTYTTTYAKALGDVWLKQTYDFPPEQTAAIERLCTPNTSWGMTRDGRPGCASAS